MKTPEYQPPDGTTAEYFAALQWWKNLTQKERKWVETGDSRAPQRPLPDGTTAAFFRYAASEAARVRQFTKLL